MAHSRVPTLTDGVVTLRAHHEDDLDAVEEQAEDPLMMRWTRVPVPHTRADAERFVLEIMPGGWASDREWGFAIEALDDDGQARFGGTVSLRNEGPGRAEIAYGAHPWIRGRGYVDRALRLLLDWGFSPVESGGRGLETVVWWAEEGNWASRRTAWRLGFSCDGTVRRWLAERDGLVDTWIGTLSVDEERTPRNPWLDVPRIVGDQVVLRRHHDDDLPRLLEAGRDERTAYWLGGLPQPYTEEVGAHFLRTRSDGMARGTDLHWMIADPDTDDLLGTVSLMGIDSPTGPEVGYWTHPAARGRGVMTEAVRLAVRHAFVDTEDGGLGMPKVRLVSAVDNAASIHVAEANGFRRIGTERAGTRCRDGWHDSVLFDLVPGEFS